MTVPLLRQLLSGQIQYLQARHAVLTNNLSNADTPGFAPKDIAAPDFAALVDRAKRDNLPMQLNRTAVSHLAGTSAHKEDGDSETVEGFEVSPAGNAVVIEEQAQKLQETRLQYELASGIYEKLRAMRRTALGSTGS